MIVDSIVKIGFGKNNCDDSVLINSNVINNSSFSDEDFSLKAVCIADGVGGNKGGKDASMFVLNRLKENLPSSGDETSLKELMQNINTDLINYAFSTPDKQQMATTFSGIFEINGKYYIAHIGNCRIYVRLGSFLRQITVDQTQYQMLIEAGRFLDAENVNKSAINGCLGGGNKVYSSLLTVSRVFEEGFPLFVVMTTDGIHDHLSIEELEQLLSEYDGGSTLKKIVRRAEENGSVDDKSIIVIHC